MDYTNFYKKPSALGFAKFRKLREAEDWITEKLRHNKKGSERRNFERHYKFMCS